MDSSPHGNLAQQPREDQSSASAIDVPVQAAIGKGLRDQYEKAPKQMLSDRVLDLLQRLDASGR